MLQETGQERMIPRGLCLGDRGLAPLLGYETVLSIGGCLVGSSFLSFSPTIKFF